VDAAEKDLAGEIVHRDIYVGNLDYGTTERELEEFFSEFGSVRRVRIPTDIYTGWGRGFAFVDMPDMTEARLAMETLNGELFRGRALRLDWSRSSDSS